MTDAELAGRIGALEAKMDSLTEAMRAHVEASKAQAKEVSELTAVLNQARGAKWAIVTAVAVCSFVAGMLGSLVEFKVGVGP